MKSIDRYLALPLEVLLKKEWSGRILGKYISCPSCGARWYTHCQGCLLERAIKAKEQNNV